MFSARQIRDMENGVGVSMATRLFYVGCCTQVDLAVELAALSAAHPIARAAVELEAAMTARMSGRYTDARWHLAEARRIAAMV